MGEFLIATVVDFILAKHTKTNKEFWVEKLTRNAARDKEINKLLSDQGIKVVTVWGCEINNMRRNPEYREKMIDNIVSTIESDKQ